MTAIYKIAGKYGIDPEDPELLTKLAPKLKEFMTNKGKGKGKLALTEDMTEEAIIEKLTKMKEEIPADFDMAEFKANQGEALAKDLASKLGVDPGDHDAIADGMLSLTQQGKGAGKYRRLGLEPGATKEQIKEALAD